MGASSVLLLRVCSAISLSSPPPTLLSIPNVRVDPGLQFPPTSRSTYSLIRLQFANEPTMMAAAGSNYCPVKLDSGEVLDLGTQSGVDRYGEEVWGRARAKFQQEFERHSQDVWNSANAQCKEAVDRAAAEWVRSRPMCSCFFKNRKAFESVKNP